MMDNPAITRKLIFLYCIVSFLLHNDFSNIPITVKAKSTVAQGNHYNISNVFTVYVISVSFTSFEVIVKMLVEREFTCFIAIFTYECKRDLISWVCDDFEKMILILLFTLYLKEILVFIFCLLWGTTSFNWYLWTASFKQRVRIAMKKDGVFQDQNFKGNYVLGIMTSV